MTRWLACLALAGCPNDPTCGPGTAPDDGIAAGDGAAIALSYGGFTSGPNNDCSVGNVVSLNLTGTQVGGSGFITLCVSQPDRFGSPQPLVADVPNTPGVHVVDFQGSTTGCVLDLDHGVTPSGTAHAEGLCGNGSDTRGYALDLDGQLGLTRCCGGGTPGACTGTQDSVAVTLSGRTSVSLMP